MSDDIDYAELRPTRKRPAQREREGFMPVAINYIRRALLPNAEAFAVINENELTQNGRARAKKRGALAGVSDIIVHQRGRTAYLELKWGDGKPDEDGTQMLFQRRMLAVGIRVSFCWNIRHIHHALYDDGFALTENAFRIIPEWEERVLAAVRRAEIRAQKPHSKKRAERPTQSRIKRMHATGIWDKPWDKP